ncbi:MAG: DUF255 domain-containing protein [Candidatus Bathyarchaeota archaeon]|nr:DUF255 domain-containing protein [Candidatus Bathyarchaeum sp.]
MTKTKVSWLPWNKESFRKAIEQDKPILLGISAVWCHWCHVMDETTYSDSEVARLVEELFVPIRVDRDQRPDIDKRYNMGGWPSTAFLTPDGEVLTGGTYIPPQQMMVLLEHVSLTYQKEKGNLKSRITELQQKMLKPQVSPVLGSDVFQSVVDALTLEVASRFDSVYGGFGVAPKFPHSEALRLALLIHHLEGKPAALSIVKKTLTAMESGGIYDTEEGGFFRYSTTRDWSIPHYEKMCEDNAKLLVNYLEAYQVTGEQSFKDTSKGILAYINAKLSDQKNGGFYGSQDADEVYYKLSLKERKNKTPPKIDTTIFVNWNAMMVSAYLLASVVLEESSYQKFALRTVESLLERAFNSNKAMSHYILEGKSHLSGLLADQVYMTKCLIDCYQVSLERKFLDKAEQLAEFMLGNLWDSNGGFHDRLEESGAFGALKLLDKPLEENSVAVDVLLRLYSLTGNQKYFDAAKKTLEFFASNYQRHGLMGAVYGLAVEMHLHSMQIHIVGSRKDGVTSRFLNESLKAYNPLKVVEVLDPEHEKDRLKGLRYPVTDVPTAYVCFGGICKSVEDPEKVAEVIRGEVHGN